MTQCKACGRWGAPPSCRAAVDDLCTATVRVCCFSVTGGPHSRYNCKQNVPDDFWHTVVFDEELVLK